MLCEQFCSRTVVILVDIHVKTRQIHILINLVEIRSHINLCCSTSEVEQNFQV